MRADWAFSAPHKRKELREGVSIFGGVHPRVPRTTTTATDKHNDGVSRLPPTITPAPDDLLCSSASTTTPRGRCRRPCRWIWRARILTAMALAATRTRGRPTTVPTIARAPSRVTAPPLAARRRRWPSLRASLRASPPAPPWRRVGRARRRTLARGDAPPAAGPACPNCHCSVGLSVRPH